MNLIANAQAGFVNLFHSKLRSLLAVLGVLVGTASVVAMVMGGQLATHEALKQFKSLGTDLLSVTINLSNDESRDSTGKADSINLDQALKLKASSKEIILVAPYTQSFAPAFYHDHPLEGMILGVTDSFKDMVNIKLAKGRFVSMLDQYNFYCVIGNSLYEEIKAVSLTDPIGKHIQLGKNIFTIIGVMEAWPENSFVYANIDNAIIVPVLTSTLISKYALINNIIVKLKPNANIDVVKSQLTRTLNHTISGKQFNFRSAKELIAKMKNQNDILTVFLGLIGSVSLIVGGIGVMNIMLVSVVERKREIGIRKAVGATRQDITLLFLMESVILSLLGGILGVLIGVLIAFVIAYFWHWEFQIFWWPPFVGFSVSVLVGIFFGFYPAYLASKLDPIEALRSE